MVQAFFSAFAAARPPAEWSNPSGGEADDGRKAGFPAFQKRLSPAPPGGALALLDREKPRRAVNRRTNLSGPPGVSKSLIIEPRQIFGLGFGDHLFIGPAAGP